MSNDISFPLMRDEDNPKVVRDQDGQFVAECADYDVAYMMIACCNYVNNLPDPPEDWMPEVN